jgi:diguanylate cyclase (GGDEF)-like protein/PAS domain S-box-containing protein
VLVAGYGLWSAILTVAYYAMPSWHVPIWAAIGLTSAGGVLYGVRRHRPRRRLPWLLLAAAIVAFNCGDIVYTTLAGTGSFVTLADGIYLAVSAPLLTVGVLLLARSVASRDRANLLDTLTLSVGAGLLAWIFLISPYVESPDLTGFQKSVTVAYPLYDVLILATLVRLLVAVRRTTASTLFTVGAVGLLVADVLYGLSQLSGSWEIGGPVDLGWIVFYASLGTAALHPSMVSLTEPRTLRPHQLSSQRLVLLALSSLIAPGTLLVEALGGDVHDAAGIAVASAGMFLLVLARLAGVVNTHRRAVDRERALRDAAVALVSATQVTEVTESVRHTLARLLPWGTPHRVVVQVHDADAPHPEDTPGHPAAELRYARDLDAALAAQLGDFELALCCPLSLGERSAGGPRAGMVYVAAEEACLLLAQRPVEVLSSQAALALDRIKLSNEINRRNSEEYFRTLVHNTADVILILGDDDRVRYASPSATATFGLEAIIGVPFDEIIHPDDRALASQIIDAVRTCGGHGERAEWQVLRAGTNHVQVEVSCRDLRHDRTVQGLVVTLRDVTERRRLESELTHRALYDSLTGLPNRALFQERLRQAIARTQRSGAVVGVLFIDLDDFKVVNDTMGHEIGDDLLVAVGERLAGVLRPSDTAARLGGDEFAAIITDAPGPADIEQIADRVIDALSAPFLIGEHRASGVASIGVATTTDAGDSQDLLRQADLALYVAKGGGKGQWCRYQSSLHTAVRQRLELRTALEKAVADGAFTLMYQPIVALGTGVAVGFEALVRWTHPTRGLVAPGEFIDIAEESGLIVPIGNWVLENALATAAQWHRRQAGDRPPYISVNVSARQFRTPGFVEKVRRELTVAGLPAECLMLEITESLLLRDDEQVWADLSMLRELGVRVAIDDFGTGYSSLSYLRQVAIDVVKIDKSFVDTMSADPQQRALVEGIVQLAKTLGLQVVAEGIEREVDREALVAIDCPLGQGYLFARPLSYTDATQWLLAENVAA